MTIKKNQKINNHEHYRYERKYVLKNISPQRAEALVKNHPVNFHEIYQQRFVNNIYLDSENLKKYFESINGAFERNKIRIRWYGDLFGNISKPNLEIKSKQGLVTKKVILPLKPFRFSSGFISQQIIQIINKSKIPLFLKKQMLSLEPTLINRYSRKYFRSASRQFRITIDTDLSFYKAGPIIDNFINNISDKLNTILELKYAKEFDSQANSICNYFPFRLEKSSKYTKGIELLNLW